MTSGISSSAPKKPKLLDPARLAVLAHPCATTVGTPLARQNRLQALAAYPGANQSPSREARDFAAKGMASGPMAGRTEIGCSTLQPQRK